MSLGVIAIDDKTAILLQIGFLLKSEVGSPPKTNHVYYTIAGRCRLLRVREGRGFDGFFKR